MKIILVGPTASGKSTLANQMISLSGKWTLYLNHRSQLLGSDASEYVLLWDNTELTDEDIEAIDAYSGKAHLIVTVRKDSRELDRCRTAMVYRMMAIHNRSRQVHGSVFV